MPRPDWVLYKGKAGLGTLRGGEGRPYNEGMGNTTLAVAMAAALAGTSLDAVLAALRNHDDPRGQVEAAAELSRRAGGMEPADQHQAEAALEAAATDPFSDGQARGKALDALGNAAAKMGDETIRRNAIRALTEHASANGPMDARADTKVYALRGLTYAAARLPEDREIKEKVLSAALDAMRDQARPVERTQGAILFDTAIRNGCLGTLFSNQTLASRYEAEVITPLEAGGLDRLYDDASRVDYRFYLMRTLALTARVFQPQGGGISQRSRSILSQMADRDPDPRLREMARLYSRNYR